MRLSKLQKYILISCYLNRSGFCLKKDFYNYYPGAALVKNKKLISDTVHKSLESLVIKDLLVALGKKTAKKWFIQKVRLTSPGRALARQLIRSRQGRLPFIHLTKPKTGL